MSAIEPFEEVAAGAEDFPDSSCDDGSPTGIGVNLSTTSSNVFIYLEGGGACATYDTCVASPTYSQGPFGKTQFDTRAASLTGVLDRAHTATPMHDCSLPCPSVATPAGRG